MQTHGVTLNAQSMVHLGVLHQFKGDIKVETIGASKG